MRARRSGARSMPSSAGRAGLHAEGPRRQGGLAASFKGKTVVLEWFNPGCPYVKKSHTVGSLVDTAKRHSDERRRVARDQQRAARASRATSRKLNAEAAKTWACPHPILLDESGTVGKAYGATNTPHMFVIDKKGTVVYARRDRQLAGRREGSRRPTASSSTTSSGARGSRRGQAGRGPRDEGLRLLREVWLVSSACCARSGGVQWHARTRRAADGHAAAAPSEDTDAPAFRVDVTPPASCAREQPCEARIVLTALDALQGQRGVPVQVRRRREPAARVRRDRDVRSDRAAVGDPHDHVSRRREWHREGHRHVQAQRVHGRHVQDRSAEDRLRGWRP